MNNDILTTEEAAEMLRVSAPFIRGMANAGEIPATKLGDDWRFIKQDLIDCIRERSNREQQSRKFNQANFPLTTGSGKRGRPRKNDLSATV